MKNLFLLLLILLFTVQPKAQALNCTFKPPVVTIQFGTGEVHDLNADGIYNYQRVANSCPTDGHYTYTSATSDCFRGDWVTLPEDHTPGDVDGNMMLVNASPYSGRFLTTQINGLKSGTTYEFSVWMMNVCRPTDKCPFPLLPDISIQLQTPAGKVVAQFGTGELERHETPQWKQYRAVFTTPSTETPLSLTMSDNAPGGCGNDFVLDDIAFRECIKTKPVVTTETKPPAVVKKTPAPVKPVPKTEPPAPKKETPVAKKEVPAPKKEVTVPKKETPVTKKEIPAPEKKQPQLSQVAKPQMNIPVDTIRVLKPKPPVFPAPPPALTTRANPLVTRIEAEAGEIRFDLYDNGEIDGDTISIYHNNTLMVSHARLSLKPISFHITIDAAHPHHELVMVANNLGSIPPNTSVMVVNAGSKRYEVFISSTEQKNAKVVFDLKE